MPIFSEASHFILNRERSVALPFLQAPLSSVVRRRCRSSFRGGCVCHRLLSDKETAASPPLRLLIKLELHAHVQMASVLHK